MPIYEYQCNNCQHNFEVIQKINDAPVRTCPECSSEKVQKLVSPAGFQLKGTGWYVTDFKNNDKPKSKSQTSSDSKIDTNNKNSSKEEKSTSSKGEKVEK